jgi:hypothetical protein
MTTTESERLVASASEHHFTEREWRSILTVDGSGARMKRLHAFLRSHDLKALDAIRALKRVASLLAKRRRSGRRSMLLTTALASRPREAPNYRVTRRNRVESPQLWRWLLATGRYRRYAHGLIDTLPARRPSKPKHSVRRYGATDRDSEVAACIDVVAGCALLVPVTVGHVVDALARGRSSREGLAALWPYKSAAGRAVRAEIVTAGDAEALVLQFIASSKAARRARANGWRPDASHWYLARTEIAENHGFRTWRDMEGAIGADKDSWTAIEQAAEAVAIGKCVRQRQFTRDESTVGPGSRIES